MSADLWESPWAVTPNPMRQDGVFITYGPPGVDYPGQLPRAVIDGQLDRGLAELIVRAVNSHAALVAALKAAMAEYTARTWSDPAGPGVYRLMQDALAQAEGAESRV